MCFAWLCLWQHRAGVFRLGVCIVKLRGIAAGCERVLKRDHLENGDLAQWKKDVNR